MDTKQLQQLKDQHGEISEITSGSITIYCKPLSRGAFKRAFAMLSNEKTRLDGFEAMIRDTVVWPEPKDLEVILERKPGLIVPFGGKIAELAGLQEEASFRAKSNALYEKALMKRDVRTAGQILQALFAGEDSEAGTAGGLLLGAAIVALVNPPTKGGK